MSIWNDKPVEEAEVIKEPESGFKGLPVRVGGDRIWLLKNGTKAWITSAEVYERLGFKFGDEKDIDEESLNLFKEVEPIK